jgi:hypothetical protein
MVGDIDTTNQLVADEIIDYALTMNTTKEFAAADVADHLAAKFAFQVSTSNMSLSIQAGQRAAAYRQLAVSLRQRRTERALQSATMLVGGISKSERDALDDDTTLVQPAFKRNMHDFRGPASDDDDLTE